MTVPVRVRFAPSPTGALHIGGLRTALYNYLFARKHGGSFILRIEDTDQSRLVEGAEEYIVNSLSWLGMDPDESPQRGGPHNPYRQSERAAIYKEYAFDLVERGKAYYAFDTEEELKTMRDRLKAEKAANQQYNAITRVSMRNSLTLGDDEVRELLDNDTPYVIRLKVPSKEDIRFEDHIRGWVRVHSSTLDDKVILKSGGLPTYHLANVVDDHLMGITHVIRGEEWLPSAPLHVLLYRFLEWEQTMPVFAHLPLILKPEGHGKLSKRDADKHGFPIFPLDWTDPVSGTVSRGFKEYGYLPEALTNFIALLGWNPGTDQELFDLSQLIEAFSLERIVKSGAQFDISKAQWFNQHYLKQKSLQDLGNYLKADLKREGISADDDKILKAAALLRDRITFPRDLWNGARFLFVKPSSYEENVVNKKWDQEVAEFLEDYAINLGGCDEFTREAVHRRLTDQLKAKGWGFGKVLPGLRLALTGKGKGPDLMQVMEILGKEETIERLQEAIQTLHATNKERR